MILLFLKERIAWITFIVGLLFCMNILFYLDYGFSNISITYFNIITISLTIVFLLCRYLKEIHQLNDFLGNLSNGNGALSENMALSPFQKKCLEQLMSILEEKDSLLNQSRVQLQEDTEDLLAWVHEMKTPLTAMKLMIEQTEDIGLRKKLEGEWMRIHLLLDQQLHSTRLTFIEKDNRLEKVFLRSIVYKEIREFQSWCMEKGIGFQVEELEQEVVSDSKWLAFIVRQILSNAIKYSNQDEIVSIYTAIDDTGHLLLHFQDNGVGIPKEDMPRIFHKSYTGTIGRESVQSTGMGLYLAQNAAQKLGIQITVQSSINGGSVFTLHFPTENEYGKLLGR